MSKITVDEAEEIILRTEPGTLSDKGDKIWTRRMAVALADLFNARLAAFAAIEAQGEAEPADERAASAIRKLRILKRDFGMKGANATTIERAIDLLRSLTHPARESENARMREALKQAQVVLAALARPEDDQNRPSGSTILSLWASIIAAEQQCRAALNRSET